MFPTSSVRALSLFVLGLLLASVTMLVALQPATAAGPDTPAAAPDGPGAAPITVTVALLAGGFNNPVDIVHAGDSRLFIVEQGGQIRIIESGGNVLATPFLDLSAVVTAGGEAGLLGLAFPPDYSSSGEFYVNFTETSSGQLRTVIARYQVSANPNVADPGSRTNIFTVNQPFSNHNAGDLNFGPDGYLYIALGDGGSGGDPQNNAQNPLSPLGKVLRLDVTGESTYAIPPDNPFVGPDGVLDEIWALGLRNPWRVSFDRQTGDYWIADVGQNAWEEVNFQPASSPGGENYGWRCYEGNHEYNTSGCGPAGDYDFPVFEYSHALGLAVTGGYVYRGTHYDFLNGHYFVADFASNRFWTLYPNGSGWDVTVLPNLVSNPSAFGEDAYGELYVASYYGGGIYQIRESRLTIQLDRQSFLPASIHN